MRMKKLSLITLSLLCLNATVQAEGLQDKLKDDDLWSVDGGVLQAASTYEPSKVQGKDVLVIHADGGFHVIRNQSKLDEIPINKATQIAVDREGPTVVIDWQNTSNKDGVTMVGPDSAVKLSVSEGVIHKFVEFDDIQDTATQSITYEFDHPVDHVAVMAKDEFNNQSFVKLEFENDFEKPELSWQLASPALLNDGQWFASEKANMHFDASDNTAVGSILLNNQAIIQNDQTIQVKSGDVLKVMDVLGNFNEQTISWQQDSEAPILSVNGKPVDKKRNYTFSLKVDEVVEISTFDEGIGISLQEYKGKTKDWLPLPKKFRFLNKGNYRIKVKSEDKVGNQLETRINFKVKR